MKYFAGWVLTPPLQANPVLELRKPENEPGSETPAWQTRSNAKQRGGDWQFKVGDARRKLKSVYPKIIV